MHFICEVMHLCWHLLKCLIALWALSPLSTQITFELFFIHIQKPLLGLWKSWPLRMDSMTSARETQETLWVSLNPCVPTHNRQTFLLNCLSSFHGTSSLQWTPTHILLGCFGLQNKRPNGKRLSISLHIVSHNKKCERQDTLLRWFYSSYCNRENVHQWVGFLRKRKGPWILIKAGRKWGHPISWESWRRIKMGLISAYGRALRVTVSRNTKEWRDFGEQKCGEFLNHLCFLRTQGSGKVQHRQSVLLFKTNECCFSLNNSEVIVNPLNWVKQDLK